MGGHTMKAIFTVCKFTVKSKDALQHLFTFCKACRSIGIKPDTIAAVTRGSYVRTTIHITTNHITPLHKDRIDIGDTIELTVKEVANEVNL